MDLVVGATGSLGGHIAHRLMRSGERLRALVREGSSYSKLQAGGAEVALGDLKNRASLDRACVGVKRVIATATAAARSGDDTVEAVDREGYRNLVAAATEAGVEQFIFVSAHGFEPDARVPLARAKVATEELLAGSDLMYTILRPALFMESWISLIIGSQLQLGPKVAVMGDPDRPYPFVGAGNVADLAIAVRGNPDADNARIPVSAQAVSYRQLLGWIESLTGREIELVTLPAGAEVPGLPRLIRELWTMLVETPPAPIETVEVAVRFGLALETPRAFIERTFGTRTPAIG